MTDRSAELEDGTLAGSILTMDGAFRSLVGQAGASLVDAARMCATSPAEQMGLTDTGQIAVGKTADLVVLDSALRVRQTYLRGRLWRNTRRGGGTSRSATDLVGEGRAMSVHEFARVGSRALLVAAAVALTACEVNLNSEGIVSRETKTFKVSGVPDVQLETFDGTIEVHSWDRNEVEVEIEKRAMEQSMVDEMVISSEQQGDRIIVKVTQPRNRDFDGIQIGVNFSPTARLRVAVPRNSQLAASSGDGSITVEDVNGKVALTTSDGSVRASRVTGELSVRSGDGSIRLDAVEGKLDLETEDGSIGVEAKPTALRARTADGSIRLRVDADTKMTEDWDVQTADGSVTLTLPSSFDGELDAETRDGSVRANHPAVTNESREGDDREERRRTLKATLGSGGRTLRVRTGDGTIRIEG